MGDDRPAPPGGLFQRAGRGDASRQAALGQTGHTTAERRANPISRPPCPYRSAKLLPPVVEGRLGHKGRSHRASAGGTDRPKQEPRASRACGFPAHGVRGEPPVTACTVAGYRVVQSDESLEAPDGRGWSTRGKRRPTGCDSAVHRSPSGDRRTADYRGAPQSPAVGRRRREGGDSRRQRPASAAPLHSPATASRASRSPRALRGVSAPCRVRRQAAAAPRPASRRRFRPRRQDRAHRGHRAGGRVAESVHPDPIAGRTKSPPRGRRDVDGQARPVGPAMRPPCTFSPSPADARAPGPIDGSRRTPGTAPPPMAPRRRSPAAGRSPLPRDRRLRGRHQSLGRFSLSEVAKQLSRRVRSGTSSPGRISL